MFGSDYNTYKKLFEQYTIEEREREGKAIIRMHRGGWEENKI